MKTKPNFYLLACSLFLWLKSTNEEANAPVWQDLKHTNNKGFYFYSLNLNNYSRLQLSQFAVTNILEYDGGCSVPTQLSL